MNIAGIQKMTLVDYPGKVATTVFTRGCSFRCPFCHNPELVLPEKFLPLIPEDDFFRFLESRLGKLKGVCITGGEPLLHSDISKFISHIKALGFAVKLDTNGSFPDRLEQIIKDGDVDYIAMDIKSQIGRYRFVTNSKVKNQKSKMMNKHLKANEASEASEAIEARILRSINLIMSSGIDYEFRTTVVKPLHTIDDFPKIGEMIKGAKRYYIQNFVRSKHILEDESFSPFSGDELKIAKKIMDKFVKFAQTRQ